MLSVYPPDSGITVFCRPCWWSDSWDGLEYGIEFDPKKPFLEQMKTLLYSVPLPDLFGLYTTLENSDYTNMVGYLKNCFFLSMADWDENCSYGSNVFHCKDSSDVLMLYESELCYDVVNCHKCYQVSFSLDCEGCSNVLFSKGCVNCTDCIGCVNLKNKQYCIFNKQYSKEEYMEEASRYQSTSRSRVKEVRKEATAFWLTFPNKFMHERNTEGVSGDYIYNSAHIKDSFMVQDTENARYCLLAVPGKITDAYDHTHYGMGAERLYETLQVGSQASNILASWFVIIDVMNVAYSIFCIGAKDTFGSVGLKKRQYCILNKQYSKEEYEKLKEQIVAQMNEMPYKDSLGRIYRYGEFFPPEMSPLGYNISSAQEFFPLDVQKATASGYKWHDSLKKEYAITLSREQIPDKASEIPQTITSEVLQCEHGGTCNEACSTAFKIQASEYRFYLARGLPLPDLCPNCRHYARLRLRNGHMLERRACGCNGQSSSNNIYANTASHSHGTEPCLSEFETTYTVDRPEIVYCNECYQAEVT